MNNSIYNKLIGITCEKDYNINSAGERKKDNNLGDMSTLFEGIDISEFPETAEEILQMKIQQLRQNQIFMKKIWMLNQKMGRNYC